MSADPADQYDVDAAAFMATVDSFISENFGKRCNPPDEGCSCCKLWELRDKMEAVVIM